MGRLAALGTIITGGHRSAVWTPVSSCRHKHVLGTAKLIIFCKHTFGAIMAGKKVLPPPNGMLLPGAGLTNLGFFVSLPCLSDNF